MTTSTALIRPGATPQPMAVSHVVLIRPVRASGGLIIPAGLPGRVLSDYQDDDQNEAGWLVQFSSGPVLRIPTSGDVARPVGGDR